MPTFEGRIRDLALTDVVQLLARGRKTGWLHCEAPLLDRAVHVLLVRGGFGEAWSEPACVQARPEVFTDRARPRMPWTREAEEAVLEALCWRDGVFRFTPQDDPADGAANDARAADPLLMEAAMRAATWSRLEPHVSHARVVPAFRDLEPGQLPPLRLTPVQWDILAHVDGTRDLIALADLMQRELVEIAEQVHGLIETGLLTVREAPVAPRRNPTPPVLGAIVVSAEGDEEGPDEGHDERDLWIPDPFMAAASAMPGAGHSEPVFDPIEVGVFTPEGLPRIATPLAVRAVSSADVGTVTPWASEPVALVAPEPSFLGAQTVDTAASFSEAPHPSDEWLALIARASDLARAGQHAEAVAWWAAALRSPMPVAEADRVREAIDLASRLHTLLHP